MLLSMLWGKLDCIRFSVLISNIDECYLSNKWCFCPSMKDNLQFKLNSFSIKNELKIYGFSN